MENTATIIVTYDVETYVNGETESGEACEKFEFIPESRMNEAIEFMNGNDSSDCKVAFIQLEIAILQLEILRGRRFIRNSIKSIRAVPNSSC